MHVEIPICYFCYHPHSAIKPRMIDPQKRFNFSACDLKKRGERGENGTILSWPDFFFWATNNKDDISMLYLLNPSRRRVDLLSVIYLPPHWPISRAGCSCLQVRGWLLSTNSSLRAREKNDSESCVEWQINSIFMPREEAALLLPAQQDRRYIPVDFRAKIMNRSVFRATKTEHSIVMERNLESAFK